MEFKIAYYSCVLCGQKYKKNSKWVQKHFQNKHQGVGMCISNQKSLHEK